MPGERLRINITIDNLIVECHLDAVVGGRLHGLGQSLDLGTVISIGGPDVHTR